MRRELIVRVYAEDKRAAELDAFILKLEDAVGKCWDTHTDGHIMMTTVLPDSPDPTSEGAK